MIILLGIHGNSQYTEILFAQNPISSSTSCTACKIWYTPNFIVIGIIMNHIIVAPIPSLITVKIKFLWRKKKRGKIKRTVQSSVMRGHIQGTHGVFLGRQRKSKRPCKTMQSKQQNRVSFGDIEVSLEAMNAKPREVDQNYKSCFLP